MPLQTVSTKSKVKVVDEPTDDLKSDIILREKATGKIFIFKTIKRI